MTIRTSFLWTLGFTIMATLSLTAQGLPSAGPAGAVLSQNQGHLFYVDTGGRGSALVLLHASTGTVDSWQKQIAPFAQAGYRVVAFDRRGTGRSTSSDPVGTAADDLLALLDQLKIQTCDILGTASGGFTAIDFALAYPPRVRRLIIANSIGGVQDKDFSDLGKRPRPATFDALPPDVRELSPEFRAADPAGTTQWLELEKQSHPQGARTVAQPLRNKITFAALETIKIKTLFITGGADMYAPHSLRRRCPIMCLTQSSSLFQTEGIRPTGKLRKASTARF